MVTLQGVNEKAKQVKSAVPVTQYQTLAPGTPTTWRSMQGDLSNFLFSSTPALHEETSNSEMENMPSSDLFPSLTNYKDVFPSRTDPTVQSTVPGPYQKTTRDNAQDDVERSTPLILAKRSLDSKSQEGSSSSYVKLSQNWITATSEPTYKYMKSTEKKGQFFQMLKISKDIVPVTATVLSSLKAAAHSSEALSILVEQPGHLNSPPENVQTPTQIPVRVPRNFMATIHETKLSKGEEVR